MSSDRASLWATLEAAKRRHEHASVKPGKPVQTPDSVRHEAIAALQRAFTTTTEINSKQDSQRIIDEALDSVEGLHLLGSTSQINMNDIVSTQKSASQFIANVERLLRRLKRNKDCIEQEFTAVEGESDGK